jgi:hypothetical protein
MKTRRIHFFLLILLLVIGVFTLGVMLRKPIDGVILIIKGQKTVDDRISEFGEIVHNRLAPDFERIGVIYPPDRIVLIGLKREKVLEVWVSDEPKHLKSYPILCASGGTGPKLKQGDMQVPEGFYKIKSLNPNSAYHLALRINYPNQFDKEKAALDGRNNLGGDIMIHGSNCSIGCLAMGDEAIEELFVLAAETGIKNISVIISPVDFRIRELPSYMPVVPAWTTELYDSVRQELKKYPKTAGL